MQKSRQQYAREARSVKKVIDSGKLKGKSLNNAKSKYHYLDRRAKGIVYERPSKKSAAPRRKKHQVVKGQGFLPAFLNQMDVVKIEELVSERIFKAIADGNTTQLPTVGELVEAEIKNAVKKTVRGSIESLAKRKKTA